VASKEGFDFSIPAVQPLDDHAEAVERFDTLQRLNGVHRSKLIGEEANAYHRAREDYAEGCAKLHAKREFHALRDTVTDAWAQRQVAAGQHPWGVRPPEHIYVAAGVPTPKPMVVAARPREAASPRRRRGGSTSRGGSSGDKSPSSSEDDADLGLSGAPVKGAPKLVIEVSLEGSPTAFIQAESWEEERRLALDLEGREHVLHDIGLALLHLLDTLAEASGRDAEERA
jgi:hypothetical protein